MIRLALEQITRAARRAGIVTSPAEDVRHVSDRRQRIAQFMREDGQEIVLAPIRFAQRLSARLRARHVLDQGDNAAHLASGIDVRNVVHRHLAGAADVGNLLLEEHTRPFERARQPGTNDFKGSRAEHVVHMTADNLSAEVPNQVS